MAVHALDELLTTLDVRLHAFALCEVQRGFRLQFDAMRAVVVHYVLSGSGVLHQEGHAPVPFGPRSIMIVAPGRAQSLAVEPVSREVPADGVCRLLADGLAKFDARETEGDLLVVCGTITATFGGGYGLFDHLSAPVVEDVGASPDFHGAFDLLLRELAAPRMGTRVLSESLMKQCLVLLLREQAGRPNGDAPLLDALRDPRLARAVGAVLAKPGAAHSLESLAAEAGMSRSVFAERFYVVYGQTPFEFVQTTRLRSAARLLSYSDLPVKAIAQAVGYASRSHFSRAFRTAFGLDPTRYRDERAANDEVERPLRRVPRIEEHQSRLTP